MDSRTLHRYIRSLTKHYPSRRLAPQFSTLMGVLIPAREPRWMVSAPCGRAPLLELDLSHPHQRKVYYFPKAWGNYWMREPFPRFLRQEAVPNMLFMDIGSHLGFFAFDATQLLGPSGAVLAFEPDPDLHESLSRSARLYPSSSITCANVALSDVNGQAVFYRARKPASSSLAPETVGHEQRYRDSISVDCRRLDDYVAESDIDLGKLKLIKCDVEGHEPKVVSGMLQTLTQASFPTLWIEVRGPEGSTRAPNTFVTVNGLLSELGYRPYSWVEGTETPVSIENVIGREDVVFRHPANPPGQLRVRSSNTACNPESKACPPNTSHRHKLRELRARAASAEATLSD